MIPGKTRRIVMKYCLQRVVWFSGTKIYGIWWPCINCYVISDNLPRWGGTIIILSRQVTTSILWRTICIHRTLQSPRCCALSHIVVNEMTDKIKHGTSTKRLKWDVVSDDLSSSDSFLVNVGRWRPHNVEVEINQTVFVGLHLHISGAVNLCPMYLQEWFTWLRRNQCTSTCSCQNLFRSFKYSEI